MAQVLGLAAYAEMRRHAHHVDPVKTIDEIASGDGHRLLRKWAAKSATDVANTNAAGWAMELTSLGVGPLWQEMGNDSLMRLLLDAGARRPVLGKLQGITTPVDESEIEASWVGENSTIPVSEGQLGAVTLYRSKLAVISTCSRELLKTSDTNVLDLIQNNILDGISEAAANKMLSTDAAVPGVAPAGLLTGLPNQASAGATLDNVRTDIKFLLANLVKSRKPVICMNPLNVAYLSMLTENGVAILRDELAQGRLYGVPVLQTHQVPVSNVVALDLDALMLWANGAPEIDVNSSSTIVMASADAPAPVMGDGAGNVSTGDSIQVSDADGAGAEVRSLFQTYSTAVRVIQPVSWRWIKPRGAYITAVNYG